MRCLGVLALVVVRDFLLWYARPSVIFILLLGLGLCFFSRRFEVAREKWIGNFSLMSGYLAAEIFGLAREGVVKFSRDSYVTLLIT